MAIDPRFLASTGREVYTGNELLVKGALECEGGVHLMTGYPGSPVAGFFDVLGDIAKLLKDKGVRAFQANNEALSVAAVNGSQMMPARAIAAFKSVGTQVASDALALGNLAGSHPEGGAVIISGDDPWCDSTQVPADCRFLFEHLRMPVVEPGSSQQLKDWIDLCFKLSAHARQYIGYVVTTAQADGGGTVEVRPNQFPAVNTNNRFDLDTASIPVDKTVLLPPRTWQRELEIPERHERVIAKARELGLNRIYDVPAGSMYADQPAPIGFIVTGMAGPYLEHVLADLGLSGVFPVLQMGVSYPVDVQLVVEFAQRCRRMIVIEERRSFLEKGIRDRAFATLPHDQAVALCAGLFGKQFPTPEQLGGVTPATGAPAGGTRTAPAALKGIPETRGLSVSVLAQVLIPLIKATEELPGDLRNGRLSAEMDLIRQVSKPRLDVFTESTIARTPTFCPGCPHRDSSAVLLEIRKNFADPQYMQRHHRRGPVDLVAHGDTGCYTMLMFAPTEALMHNYSGMGLGGGTGSGIDPFIRNKQIVFMGDGTFFHSGQIAISNAIKAGQDLTFIILENGTTAMTGHQEHAGTEVDLLGNRSYIQDIEAIVRGMKGTSPLTVEKVNPADRDAWKQTLERTILSDGVKVHIADKECGITYHRRKLRDERKVVKEKGYLPTKTHMNVTPEVCEHCLECTKATACPGLITVDTDYGKKIDTDLTWCVNDGACERVRTSNDYGTSVKPCPSFEQVTVIHHKRKRYLLPRLGLDKLPEPPRFHPMNPGDAWRVHLAGVGGMGIGLVGAILVRAGHKEGYEVSFQDKKGLAIRNGGVYSQIVFVAGSSQPATGSGGNAVGTGENTPASGQRAAGSEADTPGSRQSSLPVAGRQSPASAQHPAPGTQQSAVAHAFTGSIPYGKADLLLGVDLLEAARAIDPREQFRVANKSRTAAVLNTHKQPTVYMLLGKQDFDADTLRQQIFDACDPARSFAKNLSEICEQRLGSKQFVNIMMLGVAYQLGLIPVSHHAIAWAIKDAVRRDHRRNLKAFNIGRKLALEPRSLPSKPEPTTWEQLVTNKARILRKTLWNGMSAATRFEKAVQGAIRSMPGLSGEAQYDLALRVYDLMMYQDMDYARRYVEAVRRVHRRDSAERDFAATRAAIIGLAKVMLIKDEPYVAYLLTRYEKKQRDIAKYGVDVANGDRIVYRHHTSPEFPIGKYRLRLKITTTDWQLDLVRRFKWLRKLPGWHRREVEFREWYIALLDRLSLDDSAQYNRAVGLIRGVTEVTGYREVRYPKMDSYRAQVEADLKVPIELPADDRADLVQSRRDAAGV